MTCCCLQGAWQEFQHFVALSLVSFLLFVFSLDAFGAESENSLVALQWAVGSWTRRYLKDRLRASRDFESASIFAEVKFKAMLHLMRTAAATVSAARQAADDESELMSAPSFERHPIRPLVAVDLLHHIIASMHSALLFCVFSVSEPHFQFSRLSQVELSEILVCSCWRI
jgi:hypothetical protein